MTTSKTARRFFSDPGVEDVHVEGVIGTIRDLFKKRKAEATEDDEVASEPRDLAALAGRTATDAQSFLLFMEVPNHDAMKAAATAGTLPEWIPLLPTPGNFAHPVYGEIVISREGNGLFVDNVNTQVYQDQLPVDAEHQLSFSGAYAWMDRARQNADGSVDGHIAKWLDTGKKFVEDGAFRYTSAEWRTEWQHPATKVVHENVLIGAALTTRPFFKNTGGGPGLRALIASEKGLRVQTDTAPDEVAVFFEAFTRSDKSADDGAGGNDQEDHVRRQRFHDADKGTGAGGATPPAPPAPTPTPSVTMAEFLEFKNSTDAALKAATEANTTLQAALQASVDQNKLLTANVAAQNDAAQTRRFTDMVTGARGTPTEGMTWIGDPAAHVATLKVLAASEGGEESPGFKAFVESMRSAAEVLRVSGIFSEAGVANATGRGMGSMSEIDTRAKRAMSENPALKTIQQARVHVMTTDPDKDRLYAEYGSERAKNQIRRT